MAFNRSLFRKRRARGAGVAPFVPSDLTGLWLWLDGNDSATLPNDPVDEWLDKSGEGNNALEISGYGLPEKDVWPLNSNTCVLFDPTNLGLLGIAYNGVNNYAQYTMFILCESLAPLDDNGIVLFTCLLGCQAKIGYYADTGLGQLFMSYSICNDPNDALIVSMPQYACAVINVPTNNASMRLNKTTLVSGQLTATDTGSSQSFVMGGYWDGTMYQPFSNQRVAEVIAYDRSLSMGEVVQVEDYLYTKWSLP